tara:strand:+ start:3158 stop:3943 length:786 start_codon:yes stop_codon:yes gene_type:complete
MNDEKDVAEETTQEQATGLMAEEAQNIESEDNNVEEEGISHIQNEEAGAEEELGEGEVYERPDWFPEKFWDEKDGPNIENMAKSINHLEKKLGETAPDEYDLSEVQVDPNDEVVKAVLEFGKEKQLSNKSITGLINKVIEVTGGIEQEAEFDVQKEREKIGPNASEIIQSNVRWNQKMLNDGTFNQSDYNEIEMLGGTAEGIRVIQKLRGMIGEQEIPTISIPGDKPDKDELRAMVADPRYQTDPVYRKGVERKFNEAYGT